MALTLEAAQTLQGVAGTATAITYTLLGDERTIATKDNRFKTLGQGRIPTSAGILQTGGVAVGAGKEQIIKMITLKNTAVTNVTTTFYIGGTAGANEIYSLTIPAGGSATFSSDGWRVYDSAGIQQYVGATGPSGTITVGSVTNIGTVGPPTVTNVGTAQAAILNFGLQQGATGSTGPPGVVQTVTAGDGTLIAGGTSTDPTLRRAGITGDVAIAAAGNTSVLANVGPGATGPLGSASTTPVITIDAKGRVTALTSATITPAAIGAPSGSGTHTGTSSGTNTGDITLANADSAGSANPTGATLVGQVLNLRTATTSFPGLINGVEKGRLNGLMYDAVADWGWVGDDSTDNLAAFNNMRANLPVGARVWFPPGVYRVSGELTISVDKRIQFQGAGRYNSIIKTTSATANIFNVTAAAWYNSWSDLGFQSTVTKTAGAAIAITSGSAVGTNCYRLWITGLFRGIDANGSQSGNLSVWSDLDISGVPNGGRGIKIQGDTINVQIHNTTINCGAATTSACCEINQSGAVQVTSFDWIQGTNVILINGTAGSGPQAVYFTNGFCDQPQGSVVKIIGTTTANRIKFTEVGIAPTGNNYAVEINGTGAGAIGTSTALPAGISVVDCDIYAQNGTNTSAGIFLNGVGDVNIQNTRITGFGGVGGCAIRCTPSATNQTKLRVNGCILGPNSNLTVTNTIGVQIDAGASALGFLSITDNSMAGCGTAIIDNSASLNTSSKNINNNQGAMAGVTAQATPGATATTLTETVIMVISLPPNSVKVGTTFKITLAYKPALATAINVRARIGTSDVTPATNVCLQTLTDASNIGARFTTAQFAISAIGAGTTANFRGNGVVNTAAVAQAVVNAAPGNSATGFNSTIQNYLMITLTNTISTTTTVDSGSIEVYSPA